VRKVVVFAIVLLGSIPYQLAHAGEPEIHQYQKMLLSGECTFSGMLTNLGIDKNIDEGCTPEGIEYEYREKLYSDGLLRSMVGFLKGEESVDIVCWSYDDRLIKAVYLEYGSNDWKSVFPMRQECTIYYDSVVLAAHEYHWYSQCASMSSQCPYLPEMKLSYQDRDDFQLLFSDCYEDIFGYFCGNAGIPPAKRVAQLRMIEKGQIDELRYILMLTSNTSAIYAAEALLKTNKNTYKPSRQEKERIDYLKQSSEEITICTGCPVGPASMAEAFSIIRDDSLAQLLERYGSLNWLKQRFDDPILYMRP
jgi:hypothetical protein